MIKHDYLLKERSMKVRNFMPLILYTICLCFLLYSLLTKFYIAFTENVPREYREMNSIKFAVDFAANMNPYASDLLDQDYPFATNMYGIAMPLFLSIFVRIFGCITNLSILQICQIVTVFIELFGVCMIYYIGYVKTHSHILSVFSSLLLMACYWRYSAFAGAFPDSYGITLSIFLFLLVLLDEVHKKYHILRYVLITIILFYVKQYFVFAAVGLFFYLWINSSLKKAVSYLVSGILLGTISMFLVNRAFDLYFTETLPLAEGQTDLINLSYSLSQPLQLSKNPFGLVSVSVIIMIAILLIMLIKDKKVDIRNILIVNSGDKNYVSYELLQLFCMAPFVVHFAKNGGTYLTYYLQLWYPYVILCGVVAIKYFLEYFDRKGYGHVVLSTVVFICIIGSLILLKKWTVTPILSNKMQDNWKYVYDILDKYSQKGDILIAPHLSDFCLENNIYTSDYGQAEFNGYGNYVNWEQSDLWRVLFPDTGKLIYKNIDNYKNIQKNIQNQAYSCIAITDNVEYYEYLTEFLGQNYTLLDEVSLSTGLQTWNTLIFVKDGEINR